MNCYCCSGKKFSDCCEPLLSKKRSAKTPLELMRSRYSAHATQNLDYIIETMAKKAMKTFDLEASKDWLNEHEWFKLEIIQSPEPQERYGEVEFIAHYRLNGKEDFITEHSIFEKINDKWFYTDRKNTKTIVKQEKIGRNAPCPCNSGKKYKKCCGK